MTTRGTARTLGPEALLVHREWIERVARTLVHGDADAADLAQETWADVLSHPPGEPERPRGWLRAVLRFKSIDAGRARSARRRHEERAARRELVPDDPSEIVARAEALDRVAHVVFSLDEPYRTAVLLRWFEDLTPREIAARQRVPLETVRTRLKRAVGLVRARLDEEHRGNRGAWTAALLPLIRLHPASAAGSGAAATATGVTIMGTKLKVAAAAAVLLLVAGAAWLVPGDESPRSDPVPARPVESSRAAATPPVVADPPPSPGVRQPGVVALSVRDWQGRPVADATAEVRTAVPFMRGLPADAAEAPALRTARTDAEGRARIDGLALLANHELLVRAAGRGRVLRPFLVPDAAEPLAIDVTLLTGCPLSGRVLDTAGAVVPGAVVEVYELAYVRSARTSADANGRYAFDDLPHGLISVMVARAGATTAFSDLEARAVSTSVTLPFGRELDLVLRPSSRIAGTVTDAMSGRPVAGAKVTMFVNSSGNPPGGPAMTDADGRYLITNIWDCVVDDIQVAAKGYSAAPSSRNGPGPRPFVVRAGASVTCDISLDATTAADASAAVPGGAIEGRILCGEQPVPGAVVGDVIAGSDGAFRIEGAAAGVEKMWVVTAAGFTRGELVAAAPPPGEVLHCDVALVPSPHVVGNVSVADGRPLPEGTIVKLQVMIEREPGRDVPPLPWTPGALVDSSGRYDAELPWAGPGRVRVAAYAPGRPPAFSGLLDLDAATREYRVDLSLADGQTVRGRVVDSVTGAGIAGARIVFFDSVATTSGGSGEFELSGLPEKAAYFEGAVVAEGYAPSGTRRSGWTPGVENIVRLDPLRRVTGIVTWQDGTPVAGAIVSKERGEEHTSSGDDGRFVLRGVAVGRFRLRIMHPGAQSAAADVPAAGSPEVNVVLARGASISGRVVGADGPGVPLCYLYSTSASRPDIAIRSVTGADGAFTIDGLEPGAVYGINCVPPAKPTAELPEADRYVNTPALGVAAGTTDLEIRLKDGPVLAGTLAGEDGALLAGIALTAADASGRWTKTATTDAAGRFVFRGLQPVPHTIRPSGTKGGIVEVRGGADVAAGTNDLRLVAVTGAPLTGVVVDEQGHALREAIVTVVLGEESSTVRTDREGAFTVPHLSRAPHVLTVDLRDFVPQTKDGVTPGGDALRIVLPRGLAMFGKVVRADGSPLRARLDFHHVTAPKLFRQCWSDDAGRFRLEGFVDAEYQVTLVAGPQLMRELGRFRAGTGIEVELKVE